MIATGRLLLISTAALLGRRHWAIIWGRTCLAHRRLSGGEA